jgi:hypothetical protein
MKFIKDTLTGKDGESFDVGRVAAVLSFITGIGLQVYVVGWKGQPFDFLLFGSGIGAMAAGLGALLKLKEGSEP